MPEKKKAVSAIIITISLLFSLTVLTNYYGSTDIGDYADTAKFFAGKHQAKLRSSHSVLYGLIHAPFLMLSNNFIFLKLSSVLWLSLLIVSIYYISKDKKTLFLFVTTPVLWYMAPWINPIQLSSLLFLWGYFFIKKYDEEEKLKYLLYSSLLIGLSWAFWDAIIYFAIILTICFLYNKKTSHFLYYIIFLFIGTAPKLLVDQLLFGFAFYSILKHFFAVISFAFYGGIYAGSKGMLAPSSIIFSLFNKILVLLFIPFFFYLFFKKKNFVKNKKTIIFLSISIIYIFINSQIRYTLLLVPIMILSLSQILTKRQFRLQIFIFLILTLLVINPYLLQIKYETKGKEFNSFIKNLPYLQLDSVPIDSLIQRDLEMIEKDFPNEKFIVGNKPDDYQRLAHLYWPDRKSDIEEFISIQDYKLFLNNETTIAGKTLCSTSESWNRRDICMEVELRKTIKDKTNYKAIKYAITLDKEINLDNFQLVKRYRILSVFEKIKGG